MAKKWIWIVIDLIFIICLFLIVFSPGIIINKFLKEKIELAFEDANPGYDLSIKDMDFSIRRNYLQLFSLSVSGTDPDFSLNVSQLGASRIDWKKYYRKGSLNGDVLKDASCDLNRLTLKLPGSSEKLIIRDVSISVPDSGIIISRVKFRPSVSDEKYFAQSEYRKTRLQADIPEIKLSGVSFEDLTEKELLVFHTVSLRNAAFDVLINKDKPAGQTGPDPQMPNEFFPSLSKRVRFDSLLINNARLKYKERFEVNGKPAVITFSNIDLRTEMITNRNENRAVAGDQVETVSNFAAGITARAKFMNAGIMNFNMYLPLSSRNFSLSYSGSLSSMDLKKLNSFLEIAEDKRIKSGHLERAEYKISVNDGRASGQVKAFYKDLSITAVDEETKSDAGLDKKITAFLADLLKIRGNNTPEDSDPLKTGQVSYSRKRDDTFLGFVWFSVRSGLGDVAGF